MVILSRRVLADLRGASLLDSSAHTLGLSLPCVCSSFICPAFSVLFPTLLLPEAWRALLPSFQLSGPSRHLALSPLGGANTLYFVSRLGLHWQVWHGTCSYSLHSGVIDAHKSLFLLILFVHGMSTITGVGFF